MSLFHSKIRSASITNAAHMLEAFCHDHQELALGELARLLNISEHAAYRLAITLTDSGMLERDSETGMYRLGRDAFLLRAVARRNTRPETMH